ncbi:unnamed protein product [Closterium sp. NIES-54]
MGANGGLVGLGNVLLVEGLSANLLSVRRLQKSKAKVTFGPTSCRAKLGKLLLWDLEEKSSCIKDLWQLPIIPWNGKPPATAAAAATAKATTGGEETAPTDGALDSVKKVQQSQQPHGEVLAGVDATAAWAKASSGNGDADWETWHERLCHINIPMLQKLVKDGSLKGLEVKGAANEIGSCPSYLETNFRKFPFTSGTGPAKAPLALVHMDVVGPTRAPSLSGSRYFLTIVDDQTRAVWVYPLKTKGEVAAAVLKEWMPRAQRESEHKVKVIRTDNGGEFIGADFESVLKKKGIQHQLTVPYNPQQNGVAERFNWTLQEGARTLLGRAGLPDPFWVTALRQVALVKNRVLATMGDKQWVPYTQMGWLIWDLTSQQLTVSRDVKFLESLHYKEWKQQQQKLPTTPLIIEADEVQRPSRQVQVTVSEEEISGVTEDGGEPEVEEQQQQQQDAPQGAARLADRPRRDVRPPNRLTYPSFGKPKVVRAGSVTELCDEDEIAHCYWAAVPEPKTLAEALSGPDAEKWKKSVKEEYDSLLENETWELCELPPGKKAISSKLIFRHKYGPDGELTHYKSRLVAKGFQQTKGKDFDEIFAPVGKGTTLRVMLGMAANRGWKIKQMDITTAFLNGIILEELYMLQPKGLDDGSGRVCRLKKAIYGLKQAPRAWYHKLEETLLARGFKKSECDHSLFLLQEKEQFLMLLVYVDNILLFSELAAMIERVEEMLEMQLKCSKMGDVKYYLGMHVERDLDKGVLRLHQRKYFEGLAEKYGLQDGGKPATPLPSGFTVEPCADEEVVGESDRKFFHSMVGALNYAANHTRPHIAFATSRLASVVSRPSHEQLEAAKRLVRYADGTSIGGYVCLFGGGAVSWRSKKQNEVGLSSCETEYMALHHGVKEVGPAPSGVSQVDPLPGTVPVEVAFGSGAPLGAASGGAESGGAEPGGAEPRGAEPGGAESEGARSGGAEPGGEESEGAGSGGAEPLGAEPRGAEPAGVEPGGTTSRGAEPRGTASPGATGDGDSAAGDTSAGGAGVTTGVGGTGGATAVGPGGARTGGTGAAGAGGVGGARAGDPTEPGAAGAGAGDVDPGTGGAGAGGAGVVDLGAVDPGAGGARGTVQQRPYFVPLLQQILGVPSSTGLTPPLLCPPPNQTHPSLQPASPLPSPSPHTEPTGGLTKRREPASRLASPVRTGRRVPRPRPPPVPGTHAMALRPSSVPLRVPLPPPPESSLPAVHDPESDRASAASPTVSRLLATVVTDPSFESTTESSLVSELVEFATACRLDYATSLVARLPSQPSGLLRGSR